jgi:translocation and assembly module TamB
MQDLKRDVISLLETATGRTITFSRFSPSVLRYLDIRDMKLLASDENSEALLSVNRARIYFNLFAFIRGKRQEAIRKISIEDTTLSIDLDEDEDILAFFQELIGNPAENASMQPSSRDNTDASLAGSTINPNIVIGGKNLTIRLSAGGRTFQTQKLFFDLSKGEDGYDLELAADFTGTFAEGDPIRSIATSIALDATLSAGFDLMNGQIEVSDFDSSEFELADQTFQLRMRENDWVLRKIQDSLPVDIELTYSMSGNYIEAELSTESFSPLSLVKPKGKLAELEPYLDVRTNGTGFVRIDIGDATMEYVADISAIVPYDFLPAELAVSTQFQGTETKIDIDTLSVASSYGSLAYSGSIGFGSVQPTGTLTVNEFTYPLGRPLSGEGKIEYREGRIRFNSEELRIEDETVRNVSIIVDQREDGADFSGRLFLADASEVNLEGAVVLAGERSLDLAASMVSVPVSGLFSLVVGSTAKIPLAGLAEEAILDAEVFIQSDFERLSFSVPSLRLINNEQNVSISLSASGSSDEIRVTGFTAAMGDEEVEGSATIDLEGQGLASIEADVTYREQSYGLTGEYDAETGIFLWGDYGLDAAFLTSTGKTLFRVSAEALPIPVDDSVLEATIRVTGSFASIDDFEIEISDTIVRNLPILPGGGVSIALDGTINENAASLSRIEISDPFSSITGTIDAQYTLDDQISVEVSGVLGNESTGEYYVISGAYATDLLRLDLVFDNSPIERLGEIPLSGNAAGNLFITGTVDSPDFIADLAIDDGRFNDGSIALRASLSLNDLQLAATDISVSLQSSRINNGNLTLDFADSSLTGTADFFGSIQNKSLQAALEVSGNFASALGKQNLLEIGASDFRLSASASSIVFGDPPRKDWIFDVTRTTSVVTIAGGIEDSVEGTIDLDGSFDVTLKSPLPVSVTAIGNISNGEIDAKLSNVRIDMEGVESLITIPFFNITEGIGVSGNNTIRISGRLNDPDIFGELTATDMLARVPVVPETIGPFDGRLSFQGKKLVIDNALMPVGKGAVLGFVDFTLDHWLPREYEIELVTDPSNRNGLHIQYMFGSIDVDGFANGVLSVIGDPVTTSLEGEFAIRNTDIQIGERKPQVENQSGSGLIIDLTFTTDRQVNFFWPSKNLPVMKSAAATGQKLRLQSNYLDSSLSIVGDIDIRGGDIFYFRRNFNIRQGQIRFNENQDRFDPFINVRAEAKDRTDDGENLTLSVIIDNQPLSAFNPRFESDPPMASIDILTRLGQNIVHDSSGNPSIVSAIALTTDIISQFGIFRSVEQSIRDTLQLDLFSLRTQIIQNILTENVFPTGADPVSGQANLARYLDNTTLYLGKYLRNDLFVEAMFRLRSNQALLTSADAYAGLYIDSEIRLEWQTPLFLLEFSMLPDLIDPVSSITSSSIGLSWNF